MNIGIRKLTPDLIEDYLHFFETVAHADNEGEDRCFCVCWSSADHRARIDFTSPEKRRDIFFQMLHSAKQDNSAPISIGTNLFQQIVYHF